MKKYLIILGIVVVAVCSFGGYYVWCTYHPVISMGVGGSGIGENLKIEAPSIVMSGRVNKIASSVEQNVQELIDQHETMCEYVKAHYVASDIKLDIYTKDKQTILKYSGSAVTQNGETVQVEKEKICNFVLDVDMRKASY